MQSRVPLGPGKFHVVVLVLNCLQQDNSVLPNICLSYLSGKGGAFQKQDQDFS